VWDGDDWMTFGPVEAPRRYEPPFGSRTDARFLDDGRVWLLDGLLVVDDDGLRTQDLPGVPGVEFGPDGSAWTVADGALYVITPDAVAATENAQIVSATTDERTADASDPTTELLPGVDLVTEEVEPGVYRVVSDGVRDLSRPSAGGDRYLGGILDTNIVAGLDGSIWLFDQDEFYRLGEAGPHLWPEAPEARRAADADLEVGPDGTVWLAAPWHARLLSYDGQSWTTQREVADDSRSWFRNVEVQRDGTVWAAWFTLFKRNAQGEYIKAIRDKTDEGFHGTVRAARLDASGWEVLPGRLEGSFDAEMVVPDGGEDEVWIDRDGDSRLRRHDGDGWVVEAMPDGGGFQRAAVGPDGTVWVRFQPACEPSSGCRGISNALARLDDDGWEVYDASDGIPMMGDHYGGFAGWFEVAPDHSIWFNPIGDLERTGTECDGVASFDGDAVTYYLRDLCVSAMDVASDGTVWLRGGGFSGDRDRLTETIDTYVITPDAVAE
jgi:hypothetical protein